jgi:hypothetical protein
LLLRDRPAIDWWVKTLHAHLQRPDDYQIWLGVAVDLLRHFSLLSPDTIGGLLDEVFSRYPRVRDSDHGAILLAVLILNRHIPVTTVQSALSEMSASGSLSVCLVYGELLTLYSLVFAPNAWADERRDACLSPDQPETDLQAAVRAGTTYTASHFWNDPRTRVACTDILLKLAKIANGRVADAVMDLFRVTDILLVDQHTRAVLQAIVDSPSLLSANGCSLLVSHLVEIVSEEPDLVHKLCCMLVDLRADEIVGRGNDFTAAAPDLINIAVTLQRVGGDFRRKGLELFERLLELSVYDAQVVLDELDHRPFPAMPSPRFRPPLRRRPPKV